MSDTPHPERMGALLEHLAALVKEIDNDYRWLYPVAYERSVTGGGEGRRRKGEVVAPVEAIGASKSYVRAQVHLAATLMRQSTAAAVGAKAALERAANNQDKPTPEHTPSEYHDPRERDVTAGELKQLRRAAEQRAERGEGFGEA